MGVRGPVPKRSAERAGHRAKDDKPDQVIVAGPIVAPPVKDTWCEQAREMYAAIRASGQARYFEPSDWAKARMLCDWLTAEWQGAADAGAVPDQRALKTIFEQFDTLGTTEGARRRMGIEVERKPLEQVEDAAKVAVLERYRKLQEG